MSTLTKRQHYVWQHYLKAWTIEGKLYCRRKSDGKIFQTNTENVAQERFFYRLERLSDTDQQFIDMVIDSASHEYLRDIHRRTVAMFQWTFKLRDMLSDIGLTEVDRTRLEAELTKTEKMLGEKFHSFIESRAIGLLDQLRQLKCDFYTRKDDAFELINFLCHQLLRTTFLRDIFAQNSHNFSDLDTNRIYFIMSHILATNVAFGLCLQHQEYSLTFLKNDTSTQFIASDQPIINLNTENDQHLRLYYPLTPKVALIFAKHDVSYHREEALSQAEVKKYNFKLYEKSTSQIYANDRACLDHFPQSSEKI